MLIRGKAWVFGRNVNTDLIFPKIWFRPTYEPGEMASHLMVGIDEDFPKKVGRGDVIVGVPNFSSLPAVSVMVIPVHFGPTRSGGGKLGTTSPLP